MMMLSMNFMKFKLKKKFLIMIKMLIMYLIMFMFIYMHNFKNNFWTKINSILGMDSVSFSMSILTMWIMTLSMFSNLNFLKNKFEKNYFNLMNILTILLIFSFSSMNFIFFFFMFETSLIPIMMIIMGWGYQIDRIQASMYMMFYTLFGSLPLLMMIIMINLKYYSFSFPLIYFLNNLNYFNNIYYFIMLNLAFLIKMPMYLTHLWLPKAHVEAPISGSMILAGIMLKLGTYGMYRTINLFPSMFMNLNIKIMSISIMGSILTSMICMNQSDLKVIVAYSSIVHMGILVSSMMTMTIMSLKGSILMMIAHGLCSSGMFFLVNLNYERLKSRSMLINKNMINLMPSLTIWWFMLCISNFSAPPSLNLFSEILLFNSLIQWNKFMMIPIMIISFFSTCYSIFLYSFTQYGQINKYMFNFNTLNCHNIQIILTHWIPLNFLFLSINFLI